MRALVVRGDGYLDWPQPRTPHERGYEADAADDLFYPVAPPKIRAGAAVARPSSHEAVPVRQSSQGSVCSR